MTKIKNGLPKGAVISEELAKQELEKWFDFRKMRDNARKNIDEDLERDVMADKMIEGFMYGILVFNPEEGTLVQKLDDAISNESKSINIKELVWKPRFQERELTEPMKGVKNNDSTGRMKAYMAAITGVNRMQLGSLYYSDYSYAQTIVSYFLL